LAPCSPVLRIAWLADSHLHDPCHNDTFARALLANVSAINALDPQPDFVVFGGDLAHLSTGNAFARGRDILAQINAPLHAVVGEHDWYADGGTAWQRAFGWHYYAFDCRGVRCAVVNSVLPEAAESGSVGYGRTSMLAAAGLDGVRRRRFALGRAQHLWLGDECKSYGRNSPVLIFSHRGTAEIAAVRANLPLATVFYGHSHCVQSGMLRTTRFQGMLSTAWPMAEERRCGFGLIEMDANGAVTVTHQMIGG
jgi:3',5'-cyclic-AMP phosphodiesterase